VRQALLVLRVRQVPQGLLAPLVVLLVRLVQLALLALLVAHRDHRELPVPQGLLDPKALQALLGS